jgi:predicted nucleic acid-binding protein
VVKPSGFLDTSALFAAILSPTGGARAILTLAEQDAIRLWVGPVVLQEADGVFRRKAPDLLPLLAALLDQAQVMVAPATSPDDQAKAAAIVEYAPDAHVLAEALASRADFFITHDEAHFLRNPLIQTLPCRVGSPGDFLAWIRTELTNVSSEATGHN